MNIDELLRRAEELDKASNAELTNASTGDEIAAVGYAKSVLWQFQRNHGPAIARALSVAVKTINDQPHDPVCYSIIGWPKPATCDCWKSDALARIDAELKTL